jgi:serine protease AprX
VLTDSPRGYWRLGEAAGSAATDASGHGLQGAYGAGVTYGVAGSTGNSDTAVRLNGTGSVEIPGIPASAFSTGFSLEVWFKGSTPETDRSIAALRFSDGSKVSLRLNGGERYEIVVGDTKLETQRSPSIGFWDHLLVTWDGSMLRLYRNGSLLGSQALSSGLGEHDATLILGKQSEASVSGSVDEVALYGRALSALDARMHYWGCEDIPGATQATYTATAEDFGLRLLTFVTATNAGGTGSSASQTTAVISAQPPAMTNPPSILGIAEQGQTLTAAHGTWDGTTPVTFSHQWTRCGADGANCIDIAGATDAAYTLAANDVGHTIRVRIGAENLAGQRSASSPASETVTAVPDPLPAFKQQWPYVSGVAQMLADPAAQGVEPATIAIVDSGIDTSRADFGHRVIEQVTKTDRVPNSPGDGYGHGTAVASVAAGSAEGYVGAAPNAKLVSIDVLDDNGVGNTSDVIAAADWIYENRDRLHIKVANFSLHATNLASLVSDPLDKAVERLWQAGIVVVAASGNYAVDGKESAVPFAPGNDPFVLTVGATDTRGTFTERDDVAAPWSAWGYTRDGFSKPEVVAPGRYIAAAVPPDCKLVQDRPDRVVEPGYAQLSGTSLAAPVVSGTAVTMLEEHPSWSPDDVKGALMLTAKPLPQAPARSVGVGTIDAAAAAKAVDPPNPNLALNQFLVPDPAGGPTRVFDSTQWTHAVENDVAWGSVAWGSVAWGSAAWSSVAWGSVAWGSVAWGSVAWGSVAWGSVAWGSVAWGSTANDDVRPGGPYWVRKN